MVICILNIHFHGNMNNSSPTKNWWLYAAIDNGFAKKLFLYVYCFTGGLIIF
jgi:hypothetical protein